MNKPGDPYQPSSGTAGECFFEAWCCHCARDKAMREGADFDECDDNAIAQGREHSERPTGAEG